MTHSRDAWLRSMPVGDVWGVGRRWAKKLEAVSVTTAADLAATPKTVLRRRFSVVLAWTARELAGTPCVADGDGPVERKTMVRSRSFGERVVDRTTVQQAVETHAARACEKLRAEGLVAGRVGAFVSTKGYGDGPHRSGWVERELATATNRT